MARTKHPRKSTKPSSAQPSEQLELPGLSYAVDMAPKDNRGPSLRSATAYPTDQTQYTRQERKAAEHAMDFGGESLNALTFTESTGFPGFSTLALLGQLPEYRTMHETLADEVVRTWGRATSSGTTDEARLTQLEAELVRLNARGVIRQAAIHDQAFGGGHVYFKLKDDENFRDTPLVFKPYTVRKGSLEGLRVVEPYWVTPNNYNSIDPTAADFYKPSTWWMLGIQVHTTRLHTMIHRPVADMLKPAYSFRGVSMTQLAMPYVDNWLRTRQSVSDTVKQFSISGISMDLAQSLEPGGNRDLASRAALINAYRDNRNILFLDRATEEFFQVNTPITGLDAIQAQAQEQMAAVSHIPLVKLLGITPTGLNASADGEIRVFYDYVAGYQENVITPLMTRILQLAQLSLFGEIDETVRWVWNPLHELNDLEAADIRSKDADTDLKYIEAGVLSPEKVIERLGADPDSLYAGLLDAADTLDEVPDEDIAGITEKILEIAPPIPGVPAEPVSSSEELGQQEAV